MENFGKGHGSLTDEYPFLIYNQKLVRNTLGLGMILFTGVSSSLYNLLFRFLAITMLHWHCSSVLCFNNYITHTSGGEKFNYYKLLLEVMGKGAFWLKDHANVTVT